MANAAKKTIAITSVIRTSNIALNNTNNAARIVIIVSVRLFVGVPPFSMIELVSAELQELPENPERLHRRPADYIEVFFSIP